MTQEVMLPLTNQLFTEIRKDKNSDRYFIESAEGLFLDYPDPTNDDWEEWERLDYQALPEEVKISWLTLIKQSNKEIFSLETDEKGRGYYLYRWNLAEESLCFLSFLDGKTLDINGKSLLEKDFNPAPKEEIRAKTTAIWQGWKKPSRETIESYVLAYQLGRSHQLSMIKNVLDSKNFG